MKVNSLFLCLICVKHGVSTLNIFLNLFLITAL